MSASRGFTLIEVLVAAALTLILLGLIYWFLVPSLRLSSQGAARVEGQQQALNALNRAERDLQQSAPGGVSLFPQDPANPNDPVGVALVPLEDVDNDGQQLWNSNFTLIYWDRAARKLRRKTAPCPAPDPHKPSRLSLAEFKALCDTQNGSEQFLASEVSDFEVLPGPPLALVLEVERKTSQAAAPEKFRLERVLTMRNKVY